MVVDKREITIVEMLLEEMIEMSQEEISGVIMGEEDMQIKIEMTEEIMMITKEDMMMVLEDLEIINPAEGIT